MLGNDGYQEQFMNNMKSFTSKKLCEIIITARYLGSMKKESIICMEELARRRSAGEVFDFETLIETEGKKLPNFKVDMKKKMQIGGLDLSILKGLK